MMHLQGEWWIPRENNDEESENRQEVPGTLDYGRKSGAEIDLFHELGRNEDFVPVIHGVTTDGRFATIANCQWTSRNNHHSNIQNTTESYIGNSVYIGGHLSEDPVFDAVNIETQQLTEWMFVQDNFNLPDMNSEEIFEGERITTKVGDVNFTFQVGAQTNTGRKSSSQDITTSITIDPVDRIQLSQYINKYMNPVRNYLTLGVGEAISIESITGRIENEPPADESVPHIPYKEYEIHKMNTSYGDSPDKIPQNMVFTLSDIHLEQSLNNWMPHTDQFDPLHNFYFKLRYDRNLSTEYKFLSLMIGLENYHRNRFDDQRHLDENDYSEVVNEVKDVLEESEVSTQESQKRIMDLLESIGNRYSLRVKLEAVTDSVDELIERYLDPYEVVRNATATRHDMSHGLDDSDSNRVKSGKELYDLAWKLQMIVEAALYQETLAPKDKIERGLALRYNPM